MGWGVTEIQAVQTHEYCKSIQEILHFFKDFSFSPFSRKSKLTSRYTAPIYVLSMCKRRIEYIEGLLRYRPYKLMYIASPYKKFYLFQRFLIFLIFEKNQNQPSALQLQYMFFPCVGGKLNPWRGYWDTGRTSSWILQVHTRNSTLFQRFLVFSIFKKKKINK